MGTLDSSHATANLYLVIHFTELQDGRLCATVLLRPEQKSYEIVTLRTLEATTPTTDTELLLANRGGVHRNCLAKSTNASKTGK